MKYTNIVLTGIMGCGKTTIGKMVSEKLNMSFINLDKYIEEKYGRIAELFKKGEDYFREIEHKAIQEISDYSGYVIATGGGVIKRKDNITALKRKGIIFFIDRPLENILTDIKTSTRPLLKEGKSKLIEIYNERYKLYTESCDVHIMNISTLQETASGIIQHWNKLNKTN